MTLPKPGAMSWAALLYACTLVTYTIAAFRPRDSPHRGLPRLRCFPRWQFPPTQAVILVVDKLAMEDFDEFPDALGPLIERISDGAIGMMNVRTAAAANSANGYLSLATGGRAAAGDWAGRALMLEETQLGEPADHSYRGLAGQEPKGIAVHLGVGQLIRSGVWADGAPGPGSLGSALQHANRSVAVLGNSDVLGERRRYATLLVMDRDGTIPRGDVGRGSLIEDDAFPGGMRTDYQGLAERLGQLLGGGGAGEMGGAPSSDAGESVDVVVVDLGDLARLEAMESYLSPERAVHLRTTTLERIASFVSALLDGELSGTRGLSPAARERVIYLVSPSPSTMFGRGGTLITPVFRWELGSGGQIGSGGEAVGVLTSPTTRRDGIVTNSDFLPSILADLGISSQSGAVGRRWRAAQHPDSLAALMSRYQEIKNVHRQRLPVIQPYFLTVLALFFLGTLLIILTRLKAIPSVGRWVLGWRFITTAFLGGAGRSASSRPLSPQPPCTHVGAHDRPLVGVDPDRQRFGSKASDSAGRADGRAHHDPARRRHRARRSVDAAKSPRLRSGRRFPVLRNRKGVHWAS